jgi:hypothetical protein
MSTSDSPSEKPLFSVQYQIPKHLVIRSVLESKPLLPSFWHKTVYFLLRFSLFGIALATVSHFLGCPLDKYLVMIHVVVFSLFFAVIDRIEWKKTILNTSQDAQVHVEIKDDGVWVRDVFTQATFIPWIDYSWYEEETDSLRIYHKTGFISFLPFKDVPSELVALTKEKIPSRENFLKVQKL